jgi:hypothetical protein
MYSMQSSPIICSYFFSSCSVFLTISIFPHKCIQCSPLSVICSYFFSSCSISWPSPSSLINVFNAVLSLSSAAISFLYFPFSWPSPSSLRIIICSPFTVCHCVSSFQCPVGCLTLGLTDESLMSLQVHYATFSQAQGLGERVGWGWGRAGSEEGGWT